MTLMLHQLKTDFVRFRASLLLLCAVLASRLGCVAWALREGRAEGGSLAALVLLWVQLGLVAFTVARVVQADSPASTTAFWSTRPISRGTLFGAKALFVVLGIIVPVVLGQVLVCWVFGFSGLQTVLAVLSVLLYALAAVSVVAALASATSDFGQSVGAACLCVGGWTGLSAVVALAENVVWGGPRFSATESLSSAQSFLCLALVVIAGCGVGAWWWQALTGRRRGVVAAFCVGSVVILMLLHVPRVDFLASPSSVAAPGVAASVLRTAEEPVPAPGQQVLWSHFAVTGLPEHHVAVADELHASFMPMLGHDLTIGVRHRHLHDGLGVLRHGVEGGPECLAAIRARFPTGTVWCDDVRVSAHGQLPVQGDVPDRYSRSNSAVRGTFAGALHVSVIDMRELASLPLTESSEALLGSGERLRVQNVRLSEDGVSFYLTRTVPCLLFGRDDRVRLLAPRYRGVQRLTLVLHDAERGEAFLVSGDRQRWPAAVHPLDSLTATGWRVTASFAARQARLDTADPTEWLASVRLHVFRAVETGECVLEFSESDYDFVLDRGWRRREHIRERERKRHDREAPLPDGPDGVGLAQYVALVAERIADTSQHNRRLALGKRLKDLGPDVAPAILRLVPIAESRAHYALTGVLGGLVRREHLPELRAALKRDMRLARLFVRKHWEEDARDIVLAELPKRRLTFTADALLIAARARDPATYEDLHWYVVQTGMPQEILAAELAECPGFDLAACVNEAWRRARYGMVPKSGLLLPAARLGIAEALDGAIARFEEQEHAKTRQRRLDELVPLVAYYGPMAEIGTWLSEHRGRFEFDAARGIYVVR